LQLGARPSLPVRGEAVAGRDAGELTGGAAVEKS